MRETGRTRITVRLSKRLVECLEAVVDVGIHGASTAEVARKFIENEVERLVREGLIKIPSSAGLIEEKRKRMNGVTPRTAARRK